MWIFGRNQLGKSMLWKKEGLICKRVPASWLARTHACGELYVTNS